MCFWCVEAGLWVGFWEDRGANAAARSANDSAATSLGIKWPPARPIRDAIRHPGAPVTLSSHTRVCDLKFYIIVIFGYFFNEILTVV